MSKVQTVTVAILKNADASRAMWFYDVPYKNGIMTMDALHGVNTNDTIKVFDSKTGKLIAQRNPVKPVPEHKFNITEPGKLAMKKPVKQAQQSNSAFDAITSGKFLTVQWVKKDGEVSTHSARFGVKKYLKSKDSKPKHDQEEYILVWCRESGGLRFNQPRLIARDKILAIKAEGYRVEVNISSPWAKMIQA